MAKDYGGWPCRERAMSGSGDTKPQLAGQSGAGFQPGRLIRHQQDLLQLPQGLMNMRLG